MDIQNIRLIVFDIDGTLAETDDYYVEKIGNNLRKIFRISKSGPMEKTIRHSIMVGETVFHAFYRFLDIMGLDKVISRIHSAFSVKAEYKYAEIRGMRQALEMIGAHYPIGIITSGGRLSTDAFLEKFGLKEVVSYVISSEDCRYIKPHPAPLLEIAGEAGIRPGDCMMVGDTIFDILCARRAGAVSVAVKSGFDTERLLKRYKPDILLDSVADLPGVLGLIMPES